MKAWFDYLILGLIGVSTILLAFENPLSDPTNETFHILSKIDAVITVIFTLEALIKIISRGLICNGQRSYLLATWNVLDLFIVVVSVLSIAFAHLGLNALKAIRMLRILRPLRLIQKNKSLKIAVTSLVGSLPAIMRLFAILSFFTFIMGILATTLFAGKFYSCALDHIELYNILVHDQIYTD
jgi:hypothetical protein